MDFVVTKYQQYEKAKSGDFSVTGSIVELDHQGKRCWDASDIASALQLTTADLVKKLTTGKLKKKLYPDDYRMLSGSELERFKQCICVSSPLVPRAEQLNRFMQYAQVEGAMVLFEPAVLTAIIFSEVPNKREVRHLVGV